MDTKQLLEKTHELETVLDRLFFRISEGTMSLDLGKEFNEKISIIIDEIKTLTVDPTKNTILTVLFAQQTRGQTDLHSPFKVKACPEILDLCITPEAEGIVLGHSDNDYDIIWTHLKTPVRERHSKWGQVAGSLILDQKELL